jgi:CheY-like chemotaxis protein
MMILIADDDDDLLTLFTTIITTLRPDDKVLTASSGKEVIERFKKNVVDIAFIDYNMPMNGLDAIREVREFTDGKCHMILMTALQGELFDLVREKITTMKNVSILRKPFLLDDIFNSLKPRPTV